MENKASSTQQQEVQDWQRKLGPLRIVSAIITAFILTIAVFDLFPWVVLVEEEIKSFPLDKRLTFTLRLLFLDTIPFIISIFAVIHQRMTTVAINPLNPKGQVFVEKQQRILQNTLEQLILKVVLSLVLCTVLRSNELIILPVFTAFFLVGRLTFVLGYPEYRSFGMTMNLVSACLVAMLIFYRLFSEGLFLNAIRSK